MKKAKKECPYFMWLVLTYLLFVFLYLLKENGLLIFPMEERETIPNNIIAESISGNDVSQNMPGGNNQSVSGNTVSGNGAGESVSGNTVSGNHSGITSLNSEKAVREYLSGTLFIGDSRTASLQEYAGWDRATFYVKYGLTIWDVLGEKIADYGGENITVEEALQKQKFETIYIMLGINELGRGTSETFAEQYGKVVERIKELQPDAVIVVEAIMHVTEEKDAEKTYINNAEINARNEKLEEMAEQLGVCWLDVNQVTDNKETGCLVSEYSFDGVHLKVKYLDIWKKYILDNPF